jgi:hypothetical protein
MNKKIAYIFLLIAVLLTGCAAPPVGVMEAEAEFYTDEKIIVSLADVEFTLVPEVNYYLLMDEDLDNERRVLSRRYVKYDGFQHTISEIVRETDLPRTFQRAVDAKEWLRLMEPRELSLFPNTYLNHRVMAEWQQEEYDYTLEEDSIIYLENLKRLGAVTRVNEVLEIRHNGDNLSEVIEAVESEYLPNHQNLSVHRELEVLSGSFRYLTSVVLHAEPGTRPSTTVTETTIELAYFVDELGNPLELTLTAGFDNLDPRIALKLKPVVNDMAAFAWAMREALVNELGLHGVNSNNPSLDYANVSLHYEGWEEATRYNERIFVR